jgi:hypothetical protein
MVHECVKIFLVHFRLTTQSHSKSMCDPFVCYTIPNNILSEVSSFPVSHYIPILTHKCRMLCYRVIKKFLCTLRLQYRKLQVMFKVSPASFQTFIDAPIHLFDDCIQYSKVHIPNVFCDNLLQISNCVGIVRIH